MQNIRITTIKVKNNVSYIHAVRARLFFSASRRHVEVQLHPFLTLALDRRE
jgi:hypothetical protein